MSNVSLQNISRFTGTKMGWFHLSIIINTIILLLPCKEKKIILKIDLIRLLIIKRRLRDC